LALPAALRLAAPGAWLVALVKPQFEAGRPAVGKGGIVRKPAERKKAVEKIRDFIEEAGWTVIGEIASPILGGSGNEEFLIGAHYVVASTSNSSSPGSTRRSRPLVRSSLPLDARVKPGHDESW
jgi:hypothetical protein